MTVEDVAAGETLALRSRVLREGRPHEGFPEDGAPGTFHLAVRHGGGIVGVASFIDRGSGAWQLRGMAVEPSVQGSGIGRSLLDAGIGRLRAAGQSCLWANARDTALGFYERVGFRVVGEGYLLGSGVPHHRIELDL